jgi:hypothetical protein
MPGKVCCILVLPLPTTRARVPRHRRGVATNARALPLTRTIAIPDHTRSRKTSHLQPSPR